MKNIIFMLSLLLPIIGNSQNWTKSFNKSVNFIKMTEAGVAVVGTDEALFGIDGTGKILWDNKKLRKVEEERVEVLTGSELIFVSDKGLLARNRAINVLNGTEYANSGTKGENIYGTGIIHATNMLMVMPNGKQIDAWDIDSNKKMWTLGGSIPYGIATQEMASLTATFKGMQPTVYTSDKSGIMHLGLGHLAEYDFTSGQPKWQFDFGPYKLKKPGKKNPDAASNPATGFATMKLDESNSVLYFPFRNMLIAVNSKTGAAVWNPKANKVGKVRDIHVLPEGILVLKLNGLQLLDKSTGVPLWKKPMKIKGAESGLLVQDSDKFYMVSKKYVLDIDVANKTSRELTGKIKFQGKESFSSIELVDELIVLSSNQNVVGVNKKSGEIVYQKYFKAPGASLGNILANAALATVAMASTMNSQRIGQQNANANGSYTYHQYTPALRDSGTKKSLAARTHQYINTKFKKKGFGLAKVSKKTGELLDEVIIGDRSPVYATDENAKLIYYKSGKKEIACKALQ